MVLPMQSRLRGREYGLTLSVAAFLAIGSWLLIVNVPALPASQTVRQMTLLVGLLTLVTAVGVSGVAFLPGGTVGEAQAARPIARDDAAPDNRDVDRLIRQLGSDEFEEREAATRALKKVGKAALTALQRAAKENADAERIV